MHTMALKIVFVESVFKFLKGLVGVGWFVKQVGQIPVDSHQHVLAEVRPLIPHSLEPLIFKHRERVRALSGL
jgi:hypothetical protein